MINILDSETINKIAAGEVVERPSSVVKELVENAIDAGSTAVTIEIKDGGITFIRITDNGCGISRDDIPKAFLRHATSKIKSVEDLLSVSSLGFRGEALSSIAAVSQVEMITKTTEDVSGYRYTCEGGEEKSLDEIGAPEGTTIIVRNLFYNTPVRRKFLKTAATEAGYVSSLVEHLALSHPDISFRFINNNQNKLHTSGNMNLKDIIYGVYGRDTANSLIKLDGRTQDIKMSGFIGRPVIVRGNRSYENYYINGRYIKSSIITKAIEDAYKGFIMPHNYPFTAIHFAIESDIIDVNVHPQKMELRFSKNNYVYDFVYATIVGALKNMDLAVAVKLEEPKTTDVSRDVKDAGRENGNKPNYEVNKIVSSVKEKVVEPQTTNVTRNVKPADAVVRNQNDVKETVNKPNYEVNKIISPANTNIGKVPDDNLADSQNTNEPKSASASGNKADSRDFSKQNVVSASNEKKREERLPEPFELKRSQQMIAEDSAKYEAAKSESRQMGLFTDSFLNENSKDKYRIIGQLFETYWLVEFEDKFYMMDQHAAHEKVIYERLVKKIRESEADTQMIMPPVIVELNMKEQQVLEDNIDVFKKIGFELENFGGKTYKITGVPANLPNIDYMQMFTELIDNMAEESSFGFELLAERVATMSCKAAIKGNNKISYEEAKELIYELSQAENPFNCPHGRPTLIVMTKYEIERKFKRIV